MSEREIDREPAPRLRPAVDRSPVAVWLKDLDGVFTYANEAVAEAFGRPGEEMIGRSTADVVDETTARRLTSNDRRVLEGQELAMEEVIGERVYLTHLQPVRDERGEVCGLAGFSMEITERRRIEEHLRRAEATYSEAEQIAGAGSWEWDVQEDRVAWSDGMHRLYGRAAHPTPPSYEAFLAATEEEDRAEVDAAIRDALAGLRPFEITHRIRHPNGDVRVMLCRAEVMRAPDGTPLRMTGTSYDVTDLERTRSRAEDRLRHLEAAQRVGATGSFEWQPDSDELAMSDGLRSLLGVRTVRPGIDAILTAVDPEARSAILELFEEAAASGERVERRITTAEGRVLLVAVRHEDGDAEAPLLGAVTDVSSVAARVDASAGPLRARAAVAELLAASEPSPAALVNALAAAWPAERVELWTDAGGRLRLEAGLDGAADVLGPRTLVAAEVTAALQSELPQVFEGGAAVAMPLAGIDGVLVLRAAGTGTPAGLEALERLSTMIGAYLARRRRRQELEHRAVHDPLTALPNRALFADRVVHTITRMHRDPQPAAILYIDLDGIKDVNDVHGHAAGDELLIAVATRLAGSLRPDDTLARIGGDEFAVLAERIVGEREALRLGQRLLDSLSAPLQLEGLRITANASIGINVFMDASLTPEDVIERADAAMYEAKRAGGGRIVLAEARNS